MARWSHQGPRTEASLRTSIWRQEKDQEGACWECTAPAEPGRKRCKRHLKMHRERARRARSTRLCGKEQKEGE